MLITLTWLCYASLTPLRQRWYEMFKVSLRPLPIDHAIMRRRS
jgi:hypothetical protein